MKHQASGLQVPHPDLLQKAGIIHLFEISFELAWKLLKDYLKAEGFIGVNTPRSANKKAFEIAIIQDGHAWMALLTSRNLSTHTYDEAKADALELRIANEYYPLMNNLLNTFNAKEHGV